jgi:hypothetical protein
MRVEEGEKEAGIVCLLLATNVIVFPHYFHLLLHAPALPSVHSLFSSSSSSFSSLLPSASFFSADRKGVGWRTSRDKGYVRERDGDRRVPNLREKTEGFSATCLRTPGEYNECYVGVRFKEKGNGVV